MKFGIHLHAAGFSGFRCYRTIPATKLEISRRSQRRSHLPDGTDPAHPSSDTYYIVLPTIKAHVLPSRCDRYRYRTE